MISGEGLEALPGKQMPKLIQSINKSHPAVAFLHLGIDFLSWTEADKSILYTYCKAVVLRKCEMLHLEMSIYPRKNITV